MTGSIVVEQLIDAIATIRARVPLAAAALASYAPEFDSQGGVCRAAFAAIDAMLSEVQSAHEGTFILPSR